MSVKVKWVVPHLQLAPYGLAPASERLPSTYLGCWLYLPQTATPCSDFRSLILDVPGCAFQVEAEVLTPKSSPSQTESEDVPRLLYSGWWKFYDYALKYRQVRKYTTQNTYTPKMSELNLLAASNSTATQPAAIH